MNSHAANPASGPGKSPAPAKPAAGTRTPPGSGSAGAAAVADLAKRIIGNVEHAIVGKRKQLVLSMVAWLSGGHILLEDVPGVAKTMLARALARSVGCKFKRVQCTPDLLPTDVTGTSIFNQKNAEFEFRPGPVFTQILLADEINRATPRTQASLLEAMAEARVTVDGTTSRFAETVPGHCDAKPCRSRRNLSAAGSPVGSFLDAIQLGLSVDGRRDADVRIAAAHASDRHFWNRSLTPKNWCRHKPRSVKFMSIRVSDNTSCRSSIRLATTKTWRSAAARGRPSRCSVVGKRWRRFAVAAFVQPDDVKSIIAPVMNHRLILRPESRLRKVTTESVLDEIVGEIAVPTIEA